jgi:hypothetical protein
MLKSFIKYLKLRFHCAQFIQFLPHLAFSIIESKMLTRPTFSIDWAFLSLTWALTCSSLRVAKLQMLLSPVPVTGESRVLSTFHIRCLSRGTEFAAFTKEARSMPRIILCHPVNYQCLKYSYSALTWGLIEAELIARQAILPSLACIDKIMTSEAIGFTS